MSRSWEKNLVSASTLEVFDGTPTLHDSIDTILQGECLVRLLDMESRISLVSITAAKGARGSG